MKKIGLFIIAGLFISGLFAQDIVSKKGEPFLPEAGDWAIGIDVAPFFTYVGNMANANQANNSPRFNYTNSLQLFGKWFKTENFVWRGRLRLLGLNTLNEIGYVRDDFNTDPNNPYAQVEDSRKYSQMSTTLGFGMEKRKGKTKLQGFYGGEVVVSFSSGSEKYSYGNKMDDTNPYPTTYYFGRNLNPNNGYRVLEEKFGSSFFFGVRPFIGAEYFIFPKMSIGGEFGYTIGYGGSQASKITSEYYDFTNAKVVSNTQSSGDFEKSNFIMDNDNSYGAIKLMLHF
jgi:hypothetical protein